MHLTPLTLTNATIELHIHHLLSVEHQGGTRHEQRQDQHKGQCPVLEADLRLVHTDTDPARTEFNPGIPPRSGEPATTSPLPLPASPLPIGSCNPLAAANGGLSVSGVIVFLLATVIFSVLITWAFNNTGGSLLIAILIHTAINFTQALTSDLFPAAAYNEVVPVAVFGTAAVIVVIATRGRLGFKRATA
ncbi:MAG: CPBP family intramembrane metalloprotease [Chloroflexi bacterium]|nr:MAG: CPBP family intramembrane metalloprotease [Chloroflexota bacterium]